MPAGAGPAGGAWLRAAVLGLLAGHLALSVWPALGRIRNDFPSYYLTARAAIQGRPLAGAYERDFWIQESARAGLPTVGTFVPHPPANALLLMPLARLSPAAAKAAWSSLLALLLVASFLMLRRVVPEASAWLVALALLTQTASLRNALLYGQPYPLLLLLLCGSLAALVRGRSLLAGLLLAPVVVLKLYGLPFVLFLLLARRFRAVLGVAVGAAALTAVSVALLGLDVHVAYVTQVLRASLDGRVLDPYSTIWGSIASTARRLFQLEPELNPHPALDAPVLALALGRAGAAAVGVFAAVAALLLDRAGRLRLAWAALVAGSLAASPLPSTYHMLLLAIPAAVLCAGGAWPSWMALGLAAFAGSPLPHYFAPLAEGWGNLLAPARLAALLVLLGLAVWPIRFRVPAAIALAAGAAAAMTAFAVRPEDAGWRRVDEARGLLSAEPAACPDGLSWLVIADGRYRWRRGDGTLVDRAPCAPARTSADGAWTVSSEHVNGSWDVFARNGATGEARRVTTDPANELEPAFLAGGDAIVFASDRRRGLGATTLFVVPFSASRPPAPPRP
jgi:hypothetical protein